MLESALTTLLLGAQLIAQPSPTYHVELEPVAGGAELVTVFGRLQEAGAQPADIPLLTVLRDTLGDQDPENDRLRYVWILTSTPPTPLKRVASALSFAYFRPGSQQHADRLPKPTMDLSAPSKTVWPNLAGAGVQALQLDTMGATVRSSTRSYRGNSSDYRKLQIFQALSSLDALAREPDDQQVLSDQEIREVYSRLSLSNRVFGGLVGRDNLPRFYDKQATEREQNRGHNWELLRQRAELNGLYFQPLALPGGTPREALLWIARDDLEHRQDRHFNRQFLNIADPWTDDHLLHWSGYSQTFDLDEENRIVPPDSSGSHRVEMIPLALYSLEHPHVPLLLVDFRNTLRPKRRELVQDGANTILTGVLGVARFGNWPFLAANSTWTLVRKRQGNAVDRSARLEAYSGARTFLEADSSLDSDLRSELMHRLDSLALNPLENAASREASIAREQYAALCRYALSPSGLEAKLDRDRSRELASYTHTGARRFLADLGHVFTGAPRLGTADSAALRVELAAYRRDATDVRFLEQLLASSSRPDVTWDPAEIRNAIEQLSAGPQAASVAPRLIAQVFARSEDGQLRSACLRALARLDMDAARDELWRIAQDPRVTDSWRTLCLLYLQGNVATEPETAAVVQSGAE